MTSMSEATVASGSCRSQHICLDIIHDKSGEVDKELK